MKFDKSEKLRNFLQKNQIFPQISSIKEIYAGGSSYNFLIKTEQGEFLLKLISSERARDVFLHLKNVLLQLDFWLELPQEKFADFYMIAMPYIKGRKLKYTDCSPELFAKLHKQYKLLQNCDIAKSFIKPQQNMPQMIAKISECLQNDESWSGRLLNKYFWRQIKPELVCMASSQSVIHGDFTSNNILVDKQKNPYLLDFEQIRYGYEIEDICYLFLQLCGFRGLLCNLRHFQKLQQMSLPLFEKQVSQEYWLYGVQLFYLNRLCRRLNNKQKHGSLRKEICFLWSLRQYFRLSRYLHTV